MTANQCERDVVERLPKDLLIGGAWRPAAEGRTFDVEDPSTGAVLCAAADATPTDGLAALDAAAKALEMGKPLPEVRTEIAYAAEFFRWFAEDAVRIEGSYAVAPNGQGRFLVMRQPVGRAC